MTQVKKSYLPLWEFLQDHKDEISDNLWEQLEVFVSKKSGRAVSNAVWNDAGEVVAIFDYYFKKWLPLVGEKAVEFGIKAGTVTGYNTMCKVAVSEWTRQQRNAKKANIDLLDRVASGEVKPEEIVTWQSKIEAARVEVGTTEWGFDTREELEVYLYELQVALAA